MRTSSEDDLDLSGTPSSMSDGTIKIKVMDEQRQQHSNRNSTRRQNIYILKVSDQVCDKISMSQFY